MKNVKQSSNTNDFAVAKALNNEVLSIIICVVMADAFELPEDYEINELNRSYILLVNELEKLYTQNSELMAIEPKPFWERFEVLKSSTWGINDYLHNPDNDMGQAHIARLDRLCIISGSETPDLSLKQKKLIENSSAAVKKYTQILEEARLDNNAKIEDSWYIPEYTLVYKPDGSILVNNVLKLKKVHAGSTTERLLEQAVKSPYELFMPDLGRTSRNLSTILSSAGFTPILRQLFFPVVSKSKGVLFRPKVSHAQASKDNIDTTTLDLMLRALDADITFSA